jgi:serpin B
LGLVPLSGAAVNQGIHLRAERDIVVQGNNQFGCNLYRELAKTGGNVVFSPFSLHCSLTAVYAGADGDTAVQFRQVLGATNDSDYLKAYGEYLLHMNYLSSGSEAQLQIANSVWGHKTVAFKKDYLEKVKKELQANFFQVDFEAQPVQACDSINRWVAEATKGKIQQLLRPSSLHQDTLFVVANAVYMKAMWETSFPEAATQDWDFDTPMGKVRVPMMKVVNKEFNYVKKDGMAVLEMPYKGRGLSMVLLLPDRGVRLDEAEGRLSASWLAEMKKEMTLHQGDVAIPRFKVATDRGISDLLQKLGLTAPFQPYADFTKMVKAGKGRQVMDVFHKAWVDVNERGTEAVAASAVVDRGVSLRGLPTFSFIADRPFIFLIQAPGGAVLFMGRVTDP